MQDNLVFYGVKESGGDNCEQLVVDVCTDVLGLPEAQHFMIERAHRIGTEYRNSSKPRPIVVKFIHFKDRERVRQKTFETGMSEKLKELKLGIGVQWPKQVKDARKELRPIMLREKERGRSVRFVRDRLYVDNQLCLFKHS